MNERRYNRAGQDLGNIVELGHVNNRIPDQRLSTLFYVSGLGLTRDPILMTSTDNMWVNVGKSQFHLPTGKAQVLRGHTALVIPGRASRAFGREAAAFLEREHADVDGVICFNDLVALGLLSGLEGRPVRVVGFDGIEECAQANPPLSSVSCGIAGFGVAIASTVIDWLARGVRPVPELRSAVELIVRESSRR